MFTPGERVQLEDNTEGVVIAPHTRTCAVLITTRNDGFIQREVFNDRLRPLDNWRDRVEPGQVVGYRTMRSWYFCHVHAVHDEVLELNPVFSHTLLAVPRHSLRIRRTSRTFPRWEVRPHPTHVRCDQGVYSCYGVTRLHYCVDSRAGRAYFPANNCTPMQRGVPDRVCVGTLEDVCVLPEVVLRQLDVESVLEIMRHSATDNYARGLDVLNGERFYACTFRRWTPEMLAEQVELAMQLQDPVFVQELMDIASDYTNANRSVTLTHALRSRQLVTLGMHVENGIRFDIYWHGHTPRPSTMYEARRVFRALTCTPRPRVRLRDPYAQGGEHTFLHTYQTSTLKNMCKLEKINLTNLFTYRVNGYPCNDYVGVSKATRCVGGGCLAADVGLGKTVLMCALMQARPVPTLVVVPPTLLAHWEGECRKYNLFVAVCHGKRDLPTGSVKHVKRLARGGTTRALREALTHLYVMDPALKVCGALKRVRRDHRKVHRLALHAANNHVVLTTPGILRRRWQDFLQCRRLVVDEAHLYKSATTQTVRAMHSFMPNLMWCLTATPLSHVQTAQMLNIYPGLDIQNMSEEDKRQVDRVTLRLSRPRLEAAGMLASIQVREHTVLCTPTSVYAGRYEVYRKTLEEDVHEGFAVRRVLRRMRVDLECMCVHTSCVPLHRYGTRVDVDKASMDKIADMFQFDAADRTRVEDTIAALDTCALCLEQYENPTVTSCGHVYCRACVDALKQHTNKCPQCRQTIDQFVEMVDEEDDARRVTHLGHVYHVPDITPEEGQKVAEIERILQTGPTVVCSKYTAVIRYLQRRFGAPAITGKTTHANRDKALAAFEKDGVLLITEKSAGVGLCLQRAHNMVFVEPSIENKEQVLGRVKRLGQTQTVHVWTLVCTGTLDDQSAHPLFATV